MVGGRLKLPSKQDTPAEVTGRRLALLEGDLDSVTKPRDRAPWTTKPPLPTKTIPKVIDTTTIHSHVVDVLTSFSELLSQFTSPIQVGRLSAMPVWAMLLAPRGRNGLNGLLRNPAAVSPDSSLPPFYPRPPHWSPRLLSFVRSRLNWYLEMSIVEEARGYESVETTRPRTRWGRLGELDISSGAGPRCGWRMDAIGSAECRQGPGENQWAWAWAWACGVTEPEWELRAEADDLQAAGGSSTILSISHCDAMLKRHRDASTTDDQQTKSSIN